MSRNIDLCDFVTRLSLRLAASLLAIGVGSCILGFDPIQNQTAHAFGDQTYSANISVMNQYAYDDFPEYHSNWCGVAALNMINDYAYYLANDSNNPYLTQYAFADLLNSSSAESPWGYY